MRRIAAIVAVLAAALAAVPAAHAAAVTFQVNNAADQPDLTPGDNICQTATPGQCTLRAAIQESNAHTGADSITITFTGAGRSPAPAAGFNGTTPGPACCAVTRPVTIDGGGNTTITFGPAAAGPLLGVTAADTTIRGITITGGSTGPALSISGARPRLDQVKTQDTPGTAILISGPGAQLTSVSVAHPGGGGIFISGPDASLTGPVVSRTGGDGISLAGARAALATPDVSSSGGAGVAVGGDGTHLSGGTVHDSHGDGVTIAAQGVTVGRVAIFANAGKPIALVSGANGAIQPPQNLRIGPRRPNGSIELTGSSTGGSIELWSGDPFGPLAPALFDTLNVDAGAFSYRFPSDPQPGTTFAATLTAQPGTSEFATTTVPADLVSPDLVRARALSTTEVRVHATEALDPNTLRPQSFTLTMAGKDRPITAVTPGPDGTYFTLTSSGWKAGEAGFVQLGPPGSITDLAGNSSLSPTRLRVAAAPGDFIAPLAGNLAVSPKTMCLTRRPGCRSPGMTIRFVTSEAGKATIVVQRGDKRVGKRVYSGITAGPNRLSFDGQLSGRKLRTGRYRLLLYVQDAVGNVTDQPPITLFNVRRASR